MTPNKGLGLDKHYTHIYFNDMITATTTNQESFRSPENIKFANPGYQGWPQLVARRGRANLLASPPMSH